MSKRINYISQAERKAIQKTGVGSSDAPAACGMDDWKPELQLYLEKVGELESDFPDNDSTAWGKVAEPALANYWQYKRQRPIRKVRRIIRHPKYPWMFCSLDYESGDTIVECKTSVMVDKWGKEETDEVPDNTLIQVTHQMSCTGKRIAEIPAKIGFGPPKIYTVEFNPILEEEIIEREREFWRKVENRIPPEIRLDQDATIRLLKKMYSGKLVSQKTVKLQGGGYLDLALLYKYLGAEITDLTKLRERVKVILETRMDGAGIAQLDDGRAIVRTLIKKKSYTVPETEFVSFKIKGDTENEKRKIRISIAARAAESLSLAGSSNAAGANDAGVDEINADAVPESSTKTN